MSQSVTTVLESISKLTERLSSMEKKVDKLSDDLGAVRTKVKLVMISIILVQQEQAQVAKLLKSDATTAGSAVNDLTTTSYIGDFHPNNTRVDLDTARLPAALFSPSSTSTIAERVVTLELTVAVRSPKPATSDDDEGPTFHEDPVFCEEATCDKELFLDPIIAAAATTTIAVMSSDTGINAPCNCSTKCLSGINGLLLQFTPLSRTQQKGGGSRPPAAPDPQPAINWARLQPGYLCSDLLEMSDRATSSTCGISCFTDLPTALVCGILERLDAKDLGIISCVSTLLHTLATDHQEWESRSKSFLGRFNVDALPGHSDDVRAVILLASANMIFTSGRDSVIRMCTIRAIAADTGSIQQKVVLLENSVQKILKEQGDLKELVESSINNNAGQLDVSKFHYSKLEVIFSALSVWPNQLQADLKQQQRDIFRIFTKEMEGLNRAIRSRNIRPAVMPLTEFLSQRKFGRFYNI